MPTVFDNSMVAHVWAQNRQSGGRSSNGNFYFSGRTLYSYGSHFAVGCIAENGVVFLNSDSYSISTSRHKSEAWRAVRGRETYDVPGLTELVNGPALRRPGKDAIAQVEKHIAAHADMADSSAVALFIAAGEKPGERVARRVATIKARAAKAAAKARAAEHAAEKKQFERYARHFAAMSEKEFSEYLNRLVGQTWFKKNWYGPDKPMGALPDASKEWSRWHKAAKARGWNTVAAVLFSRLRVIRATLKTDNLGARRRLIGSNELRRAAIAHVRHGFKRLASGQAFENSYSYRSFAEYLGRLCPVVPALVAFRDAATAESERLQVLEHEAAERAAAERAAAREAARIEAAKAESERRANWFAGLPHAQWSGRDPDGNAYIRAVGVERDASGAIVNGTLQTSQGADVPLTHAIRAFRFIKLCRASGKAWHANGHSVRVGHFMVDWIDAEGNFKAGCHMFAWPEIERVAVALGVFEAPADDAALEPSHKAA